MALTFGMPHGISEDLESVLAAIQTWAGKQEGLGKWLPVPYDAANFSSDVTNGWTVDAGDVVGMNYSVVNNLMVYGIDLNNTTIAGSPTQLHIRLPGGYRQGPLPNDYVGSASWNGGAGVNCTGHVYVRSPPYGDMVMVLRDIDAVSTAWPNRTNTFDLSFMVTIPVYRDLGL